MNNPTRRAVGTFTKTNGNAGALLLTSTDIMADELEALTEIFVIVDGLSVPFPVKDFTIRNDFTAVVKLEFVDSPEEAAELIGCEVQAEVETEETEAGLEQFVGFTVVDARHGRIGTIEKIEDYHGNIVMQVMDGKQETLIPLFPELVTEIDDKGRTIHIDAPEGLLGQNL